MAELARMRVAANPALRRTIDAALEGMLEDDSRRVRDAASAALGQAAPEPPDVAKPAPTFPPNETRQSAGSGQKRPLARRCTGDAFCSPARLAAVLAGGVIAFAVSQGGPGGSSGSSTVSLPLNPARGTTLGSDLTPFYANTCFGADEACSVVQYALAGRPTVSASNGVITTWSARGRAWLPSRSSL